MSEFTDAPASNTFKVKSANGFEHLFTMRDSSVKELLVKIETVEKALLDKGWAPLAQNNFARKEAKPIEYVEGKICPNCQNKLVYGVTKQGKKFIKCSTQKYDFATKSTQGCPFVDWMNDANNYTNA